MGHVLARGCRRRSRNAGGARARQPELARRRRARQPGRKHRRERRHLAHDRGSGAGNARHRTRTVRWVGTLCPRFPHWGATVTEGTAARRADLDIAALYRNEAAALVALLSARTGDRAVAEDIAQEAFVRVQRAWHRIADMDLAPAYLRSVALNLLRSRWRHEAVVARHSDLFVGHPAPSAESAVMFETDRV